MFKSKAEHGFMHSMLEKRPPEEVSEGGKLPSHVEEKDGGYACMHCGGEVGEDGSSIGYDDTDSDETPVQDFDLDEQFAKAVKGGR